MIRILIADDHSMIRKGLKLFMELNLGCTDISEVATCNDLMKELVKKKYTHLVLDIILADGNTLEIIPNIRRVYEHQGIYTVPVCSVRCKDPVCKQF